MAAPRRLILLRHGETQANVTGVWQGHLDVPLTERGIAQAAAAAPVVAAHGPVRVVASDLQRTAVTGRALAEVCGLPLDLDARWREFDVGQWTGLSSAEVIALHPQERQRALRGEEQRRGIDGEGPSEVADRVRPALAELIGALPDSQCAVIVSHGGTIKIIAALLLGLDTLTTSRLLTVPGNCEWADLVEGTTGWRIAGWNLRALSPNLRAH